MTDQDVLISSGYLADLWAVMHHSTDAASRQAVILTCYMDESGQEGDPIAVVGGLLLELHIAQSLSDEWLSVLKKHRIDPPLHMREFNKSNGKYALMPAEMMRSLFLDLVKAVKSSRVMSIAACMDVPMFKSHCAHLFKRGSIGPYGVCFGACALENHEQAKHNGDNRRIAYLLDSGNSRADQVRHGHAAFIELQNEGTFFNVGSLTFDSDSQVVPLQAADMIAWSVRRRADQGFTAGFEPLGELFDEGHAQHDLSEDYVRSLAQAFSGVPWNHETRNG